jgi:hypothetical protein
MKIQTRLYTSWDLHLKSCTGMLQTQTLNGVANAWLEAGIQDDRLCNFCSYYLLIRQDLSSWNFGF